LKPNKAPGPAAFSIHFYRLRWAFIKKDLLRKRLFIQKKGNLGGSNNSSFLALIPKESNPSSFSRFRPISISLEIISKLMANIIKGLLPSLIFGNQGGFVQNRKASDNIILVQGVTLMFVNFSTTYISKDKCLLLFSFLPL